VRRHEALIASLLPTERSDDSTVARLDLVHAMLRLPVTQRAVLVLRYFEDMAEAEVAAALGVSVGTVKSRAARGLTTLRKGYGRRVDV
jgi:RNA polymerase sigma factor (sigma-70 family)